MTDGSAVVFDAYGTLFDVHSVVAACNEIWPNQGEALSRLWRSKQLEYTWLRTLMGRYADFYTVTAEALAYACAAMNLQLTSVVRDRLMDRYQYLSAYPEVPAALTALRPGRQLAIFSNGSPDMLDSLVTNAGLADSFDQILSVDGARVYKPDPRAFALVAERLRLKPALTLYVSSHPFDVAGARSFGFRGVWVNRVGATFDRLGVEPELVVTRLTEIAAALE